MADSQVSTHLILPAVYKKVCLTAFLINTIKLTMVHVLELATKQISVTSL